MSASCIAAAAASQVAWSATTPSPAAPHVACSHTKRSPRSRFPPEAEQKGTEPLAWQYNPASAVQSAVVPQAQSAGLAAEPSMLAQSAIAVAAQRFQSLRQYRPEADVHAAVPHTQAAALRVSPVSLTHAAAARLQTHATPHEHESVEPAFVLNRRVPGLVHRSQEHPGGQ